MNNHLKQELSERLMMDLFKKHFPDFPKGKLIKSESPDFILKINPKKSIGIELRQIILHSNPDARKQISLSSGGQYTQPETIKGSLERILENKEEKIAYYQKKRLDQIWLVISVTDMLTNVVINIKNQIGKWDFQSRFNKVFLLESNGRIHDLV